jgi:hypothetical protein
MPVYRQECREEIQSMRTKHIRVLALLKRWGLGGCKVFVVSLISLAVGSVVTACFMHLVEVRAESNRVFELNIYHAVPGKVPALESRFRDATKLISKHDLNVVAYWVPEDDPSWTNDPAWANTFVYVVAHPNWHDAKVNWEAFHDDPGFQLYRKSEDRLKLIEKVDKVHMRATDFSTMK